MNTNELVITARKQQTTSEKERSLALDILQGYCRDIPYEVFSHIVVLYDAYGMGSAMRAAKAVVSLQEMHRQFG